MHEKILISEHQQQNQKLHSTGSRSKKTPLFGQTKEIKPSNLKMITITWDSPESNTFYMLAADNHLVPIQDVKKKIWGFTLSYFS